MTLSISVFKVLFIFIVSLCFAPMGLRWFLPYIHQKNLKAKLVGLFALILTIVSISLTFFTLKTVADQYTKLLNNPTYKIKTNPFIK
jgi:uncharacterized protein YebE (UPF0316 family)